MATTIRHGGESHFVRPDGVYRTSVLAPIVGYQPDNDVQSITQAFVAGPVWGTYLQNTGDLNGALATGWGRLKLWWHSKFGPKMMPVQAVAAKPMAGAAGLIYGAGPEAAAGQQIAPQLASQMRMLMRLTPQNGVLIRDASQALVNRRPITFYKAG